MRYLFLPFLLLFILGLSACKNEYLEEPMDSKEMENLLYDYQLMEALVEQRSDSADFYHKVYMEGLLKKYDLNSAQFDSILLWYASRPKEFAEVYKSVEERLAKSSSATVAGDNPTDIQRDSTRIDLWKGVNSVILTPENKSLFTFSQPLDTATSAGDVIHWRFSSQWIYREGLKSASALFTLVFSNDSTSSTYITINSSGEQELSLPIDQDKVKEVRLAIQQNAKSEGSIKVLHLHHFFLELERVPEVESVATPADTLSKNSSSNQTLLPDTMQDGIIESHFR